MYENTKRDILKNFIEASVNLHDNYSIGGFDKYHESINLLYIYFEDIPSDIESLPDYRDSYKLFEKLSTIVQSLSKQISKK